MGDNGPKLSENLRSAYTTISMLKKASRRSLPSSKEPHWEKIVRGISLGYLPNTSLWYVRKYQQGRYVRGELGPSDDVPGGLSYTDACRLAISYEVQKRTPTVHSAWLDYERYLIAHGKSTQATGCYYKLHIQPLLGDVELARLTLQTLEKWQQELITRLKNPILKIRQDSANRITTILKALLNRAFHSGLVESDTAWRRLKRFQGVGNVRIRTLSQEEISKVLEVIESPFKELFLAALHTGARLSELRRLEPSDFTGTHIHIRQSKSGKPRHIPLSSEGIEFFRSVSLPLRPKTQDRWGQWSVFRYLDKIERKAQIRFRMHDLRHTYATRLLNNGALPSVVAALLGHSSTRMVEKHYGHLYESTIRDNVERYLGKIDPGG